MAFSDSAASLELANRIAMGELIRSMRDKLDCWGEASRPAPSVQIMANASWSLRPYYLPLILDQ